MEELIGYFLDNSNLESIKRNLNENFFIIFITIFVAIYWYLNFSILSLIPIIFILDKYKTDIYQYFVKIYIQYKIYLCIFFNKFQFLPESILEVLILVFSESYNIYFYDNDLNPIEVKILKITELGNTSNIITNKFLWRYSNTDFTYTDLKLWIKNSIKIEFLEEDKFKIIYVNFDTDTTIFHKKDQIVVREIAFNNIVIN